MQVWRNLHKHLRGNRREQKSNEQLTFLSLSSSPPGLPIGGLAKQQTPTSIFYVPVDCDADGDETVMSLPGAKINGAGCTMDSSPATHLNNDSSSRPDSFAKPTPQPKPTKTKKPRQIADSAANDSHDHSTTLIMCQKGTLYPPGYAPVRSKSAQQTTPAVTKPQLPVCYC